jgi:hypothetical protein
MDAGPVATFQVHEYLKPKVSFLIFWERYIWRVGALLNGIPFVVIFSSVIYMKMIPSLTSSSVV